jgi:hypothetical protein
VSRKSLLQKLFALVFRTLFQQKLSLFTPAARGSFAASDEEKLNFTHLLLQTRILLRAALFGKDAISLYFHKEMAKERKPKGRMPFGNPQSFPPWQICRSCWLCGGR